MKFLITPDELDRKDLPEKKGYSDYDGLVTWRKTNDSGCRQTPIIHTQMHAHNFG